MYYDDFYNEPSDFELQIMQFKESLLASVKTEHIEEMNRLREENASLQDVKKRLSEIENNYRQKERELGYAREKFERDIKNKRLNELLGENFVQAWGVKDVYSDKTKCDKCNERRQIEFLTPRGFKETEPCECSVQIMTRIPFPVECFKFVQCKDKYSNRDMSIWTYYTKTEEENYDNYNSTTNIYQKGQSFDKVNRYEIVFLDHDKCQEYCDWLNQKNA